MTHANATLTPAGRLRLAKLVVEQGWTYARAAERFSVAITTVRRWATRYRLSGKSGMVDRSSRPHRHPNRLPQRTERRIVGLRVTRRWGPARIAYHLGLNPSTVHQVLRRYGCPRLKWTDPATGTRIKTSSRDKNRYEHAAPGDLVHVDIKKLGRIPDGGGWHALGRGTAQDNRVHARRSRAARAGASPSRGYVYLHHAVDDHSRLAYSEILADERKETAAAFWKRARRFFTAHGITVKAVLTDNGSCYRSRLWAKTLGRRVKHRRTRPYRPQTNGKVERFNRTLLEEWAYATTYTSEADRAAAYPGWLHHYNHHRGHTSLKGKSPIDRVPNLPGQNS
ncbi:IS481 family transposase [Nocardioides aromaticivorans]|uniref:IS481 family transposase n=1 Tax=Nocardioides aromaticivorans TaxID=200618 RepID=A0ABX7PNH9_9ACTN|nr:IS481 family transposase [Nocardioides aromaticivorans]QSR27500.1 IS481 family transposase [Nocardioides aromaticivorans]